MKKPIALLPIFLLLLLFSFQVKSQTASDLQFSQLQSSIDSLQLLSETPEWASAEFRNQFKTSLENTELTFEAILNGHPESQLSTQQKQLQDLRKSWESQGKPAEMAAASAERAEIASKVRMAHRDQYTAKGENEIAETKKQETRKMGLAGSALVQTGTKVEVKLKNTCSTSIPFSMEENGKLTFDNIKPLATTYKKLKAGTKIYRGTKGSKGMLVGTISKTGQILYICR